MNKNQHTTFLNQINAFQVYPEIIFSTIIKHYGNSLKLNNFEYTFDEGFVLVKSDINGLSSFSPVDYTSAALYNILDVYKQDTGNTLFYNYFELLMEFFELSAKYERENKGVLSFSYTIDRFLEIKLRKIIKKIKTFHKNKDLAKLIIAHEI